MEKHQIWDTTPLLGQFNLYSGLSGSSLLMFIDLSEAN